MKLEVHLLSHDHEPMTEYALRHWHAIGASVVVVHDGGPKGRPEFADRFVAKLNIRIEPWDTGGQLNDQLARGLKNTCWRGTDADWVACVDADELLHFPHGLENSLRAYERAGAAVIKPHGFEMFSEDWFEPSEMPGQLITKLAAYGASDDKWYGKPVLFSPKRVADSGFGIGAHDSHPVLKDGRRLKVDGKWPKANPPAYLLHYHQLGSLERVAMRYDETRKRLARVNEANRWGNFAPGREHCQEKREAIIPRLVRVIA